MKSAIALVASAAFVSAAVAGAIPATDLETRAETNHHIGIASREPNKPYRPDPLIIYASATHDLLKSLTNAVEDCDESAPETIKEEPSPAPIKEEPAPAPIQEEPASAPIKEEPAPAPIQEEPASAPIKEEPASAPIKEKPEEEHVQQDEAPPQMASLTPQSDTLDSDKKSFLDVHNEYRGKHKVGLLTWNDTLGQYAAEYASSCNYGHNKTLGFGVYGQNIAFSGNSDFVPVKKASVQAMTSWYDEINSFGFNFNGDGNPSVSLSKIGHFTQMVWKKTTTIGCATYDCTKKGTWKDSTMYTMYTVCNYGPPGNVMEHFVNNVNRPN